MLDKSNTLDHLVFLVDNLAQSRKDFEQLGFTVTSKSVHTPMLGTANCMVMFDNHYIELLAIESPTEANQPFRDILAHFGQKLFGLAFGCESASELAENFGKALGKTPEVSNLDRELTLPSGENVKAEFNVCIYPCLPPIGMAFFACQHKTPEYIWIPEQLKHQNTATGVKSVTIKVDDINMLEAAIRPCFNEQALIRNNDILSINMPSKFSFVMAEAFYEKLGRSDVNNSNVNTIVEINLSNTRGLTGSNISVEKSNQPHSYDAVELVCGTTLLRFITDF